MCFIAGLVRAAGSRTIAGFAPCRRLAVLLLALARAAGSRAAFLRAGFPAVSSRFWTAEWNGVEVMKWSRKRSGGGMSRSRMQ